MDPNNQQPTTPEAQPFTPNPALQPPVGVQRTAVIQQPATLPYSAPSSSRKFLVPIIVVSALLLVGGVAAAVMLTKKSATPGRNTKSTAYSPLTFTPSPSLIPKSELVLNKLIKANFGITVTLQKLVQHLSNKEFDQGDEGVLVQAKMESDGSYPIYSGRSQFQILADGKVVNVSSRLKAADLAAAGYPQMPEVTLKKGTPSTGYWLYLVPVGTKKITFRFHQVATKILGGSTVAEKNDDVVLVE